jgi:hypothetical protein
LSLLLRHVVVVKRQRPGRVVEEAESLLIWVAEVDVCQVMVWREVEGIHLTLPAVVSVGIGDEVKAVQVVDGVGEGLAALCALSFTPLSRAWIEGGRERFAGRSAESALAGLKSRSASVCNYPSPTSAMHPINASSDSGANRSNRYN